MHHRVRGDPRENMRGKFRVLCDLSAVKGFPLPHGRSSDDSCHFGLLLPFALNEIHPGSTLQFGIEHVTIPAVVIAQIFHRHLALGVGNALHVQERSAHGHL